MNYEEQKNKIREQRLGLTKSKVSKNEEIEGDIYKIDEQWQRFKRIFDRIEPRLYKFLFQGTYDASKDARNDLNELRKMCIQIRGSILKQRQDNESNY
jgi:hypothetical protein